MTNEVSRSEEARRAEVRAERKKPVVAVAERRAFATRLQHQAQDHPAPRPSNASDTIPPPAATRLAKPQRPSLPQDLAV
ncbi:MAG: hypothetical protein KDB53_08695, partial [Planctomycetes bacterium]|nr:hypothetical protein [Planctomycetota bacterium]